MATRDQPEGIGGWLLAFLIGYCVIGPLGMIVGAARALFLGPTAKLAQSLAMSQWQVYVMAECVITALGVLLIWIVGWRLVARRNCWSVRIAIGGLWLIGPLYRLCQEAAGMALLHYTVSWYQTIQWPGIAILGAWVLVHAGLWTTYFLRSKRVANTFNAAGDKALDQTFA